MLAVTARLCNSQDLHIMLCGYFTVCLQEVEKSTNNLGISSVSEKVPKTLLGGDFFNQSGKHALFQAQSLMTVNQERIAINLFNYINLFRHNLNLLRFSKRMTTLKKWGRLTKMGNGSHEGFTVFGLCSYHMSDWVYYHIFVSWVLNGCIHFENPQVHEDNFTDFNLHLYNEFKVTNTWNYKYLSKSKIILFKGVTAKMSKMKFYLCNIGHNQQKFKFFSLSTITIVWKMGGRDKIV